MIIVVGGAQGVGEAIVERLARDNTTIVIADSDANERLAQQVADNLAAAGRSVIAETVDITDIGEVAALTEATVEFHGRLDALVFCDAAAQHEEGVESLVQFAGSEMQRSGGGTIVLITDNPNVIDLTNITDTKDVITHAMSPSTFRILDEVSALLDA